MLITMKINVHHNEHHIMLMFITMNSYVHHNEHHKEHDETYVDVVAGVCVGEVFFLDLAQFAFQTLLRGSAPQF